MPLDEGQNLSNIVKAPNVAPITAEELDRKAQGEPGVRQGFGPSGRARTVEVGATGSTCPLCGESTLKADMRRKVNRIYCSNPECTYDQSDPKYSSGTGGTGVEVLSRRGAEGAAGVPSGGGVKIISNKSPSQ